MLTRLTNRLSTSFPSRFFSTPPHNFTTLSSLFKEAEFQLSSPNSFQSAITSFKSGIKIASEIFPQDYLQQSYWCILAALQLFSKNHLKESQEFLQESVRLLNQHDPNDGKGDLCKVYKMIGNGYYYLKDFIKSEEYYSKGLSIAYTERPELITIILENLIKTKINLKKVREAVELCEKCLGLLGNAKDSNEKMIPILICYGKCLASLKELDKAIKQYRSAIELILLRGNEVHRDYSLAIVYDELIDALIISENDEKAAQETLEGAVLIEKWFGIEKSLGFCEVMYRKFKNADFEEPVVKVIVDLSERAFPDAAETAKSYNLAEEHYYRKGNLSVSLEYAKKSMKIAKKLNDSELIIKSCERLGLIYLYIDPDVAKTYIELGKKLLDSVPSNSKQSVFEYLHFRYFSIIKDYINACKSIEVCLALTPETKSSTNDLIKYHIEYSDLHYDHNHSEKSLSILFKSLEILDRNVLGDHPKSSEVLSKIGSIYAEKNDYNKSIDYLSQALKIGQKYSNKNFSNFLAISSNLMRSYSCVNRLDLGLNVGETVLKMIEERKEKAGIQLGIFYLSFSSVNLNMNEINLAKAWGMKGREVFIELGLEEYIKVAEDLLTDIENSKKLI